MEWRVFDFQKISGRERGIVRGGGLVRERGRKLM